jgi:hypothetical protein
MTASLVALLLVLAPVVPESGRFTIRQDGRTIGTENFTIRSTPTGFRAEGRTELAGVPNPITSRMELDENLNPISYEYSNGQGVIRLKVEKPLSELTVVEGGTESSTDVRFPDGGSIVDNNFFHHYLLLMYRVRNASQNLWIFVPQDMRAGQAQIQSTGARTYALEVGDVKLEATVDADGRLQRLAVPSAKVVVER